MRRSLKDHVKRKPDKAEVNSHFERLRWLLDNNNDSIEFFSTGTGPVVTNVDYFHELPSNAKEGALFNVLDIDVLYKFVGHYEAMEIFRDLRVFNNPENYGVRIGDLFNNENGYLASYNGSEWVQVATLGYNNFDTTQARFCSDGSQQYVKSGSQWRPVSEDVPTLDPTLIQILGAHHGNLEDITIRWQGFEDWGLLRRVLF